MERWLPVPEWEFYEASDLGRVRSVNRTVPRGVHNMQLSGKMLKQNKSGSGYFQVVLCKSGIPVNTSVHRIIAKTFLPDADLDGFEVCHIDGDKGNNRASNLRVDTRKGNMFDCRAHGTAPIGENNAHSKLTDDQVLKMREEYSRGNVTISEIARSHGISRPHVSTILRGKAWSHVGGPLAETAPKRGTGSPGSKLTESDVLEIRREYASGGVTCAKIASKYGVNSSTIGLIVKRINWSHI